MRRAGIAAGLTALLTVALAVGPAAPSQAARAPLPAARAHAAQDHAAPSYRRAQDAPTLAKLVPATAPTGGGVDVVITGQSLSGARQVLFGSAKATHVRIQSSHKIVVRAPAHVAGLVIVKVVTRQGSSGQGKASRFTYADPPPTVPAPTVLAVAPRSGPTSGGNTLTVTGTDLTGATSVRLGSVVSTSLRVVSPTTLVVTAPAHATGAVDVRVTTPDGSSTLEEAYSYVPVPTLHAVTPGTGPAAGQTVTVSGTGFTADTTVAFGGVAATSVHVIGTDELTATTPTRAAGWVDVTARTPGGTATLTNGFMYVSGTTLTAVAPSVGPVVGGSTVTLTGTGFTGDTLVTFGNKPSLDTFVNLPGTELTALLPPHAAGTVDVTVATVGGSATLVGSFTFVEAPALTSVAPTVAPVAGGTAVTLTGTNLRAGMQVRFGGTLGTLGSVNPAGTSASVTAPAHAAGLVDVSSTTPGGTVTLPGAFTYVAVPTLTAASPNEGPAGGAQLLTLTGTGFRAGMQVSIGGTVATGLVVVSATEADVVTPAHAAGAANVVVTTPGGTVTLTNGYTFVVAPVPTSVAPGDGPIGGGATVTLTGSGFRAGMQVRFDGVPAFLVSVTPTSATVTTPAHAAGSVDVTVTTAGGATTMTGGFTYVASPTVALLSPNEGPTAGGQTVILTGTGFRAGMQVWFGGVPATGLNVLSTSQATVVTPAHGAGVVDVSVLTTGGAGTLPGGFIFAIVPTLTSVAPTDGPTSGDQAVTLTGTGFGAGMQVRFGGVLGSLVSVNPGGTSAVGTSPAHAAGTVDVSVTTPGGAVTLTNGYGYVASPTLTAVTPTEGPTAGGRTVALTGSGFRAGMQVSFGGQSATGLTVVTSSEATVVAPAHAAGAVTVTVSTPGGTDSLVNGYTYVEEPLLTALTPDSGPLTGGTTVTLTGDHLTGTIGVTFDGAAASSVTVVNDTTVEVVTPAHPFGPVDVQLSTAGGSTTASAGFTYLP